MLGFSGCTNHRARAEAPSLNPVKIKEWPVPWDQTRPRDPYVDQQGRVWFVGQGGDYIALLDPEVGQFHQFKLDPGTGPHNLIVDKEGQVWYAGNRAAHIGKLDPSTGKIIKYPMPDQKAFDPHTLEFGLNRDIWFTVQQGNFVGNLDMGTGKIQLMPLPTPRARPYGIVLDRTHSPWFTEFGTNKLGTVDPETKTVREITLSRKETRPRRLGVTSDGIIWYVDYAEGYLGSYNAKTGDIQEWLAPGGSHAKPYGMTVDDRDRVWFVETGSHPNRLVGFDTRKHTFMSLTDIPSGGGSVRHMVYHQPTKAIWFGTDANTIGRAKIP
ncbi:MAG TPA: lyase [Nitrospiraceae bacterium]|nr:lyase [Nitrospiraceae bacterium]